MDEDVVKDNKQDFKKVNKKLLEKYSQTKDKNIIAEIIQNNERLIKSICKKYLWSDIEYEDLYQIACVGMIKSIKNFDLSKCCEFTTYTVPMILGEIKRYLRDTNYIHISRDIKNKLNKMHYTYNILVGRLGNVPNNDQIASEMNISLDELNKLIKISSEITLTYLDKVFYNSDGENETTMGDLISDDNKENDYVLNKLYIEEILSVLNDNEKNIIRLRFYEDKTQMDVANELGISQVKVSRIEKKALGKMREFTYK